MITAPTQSITESLAQAPMPQADHERKQRMRDAWRSYRGEFERPLKVARDQPDDNVLVNYCGPIVDKGASWLFSQVVKIEATTDDSLQDFIDGLWGDDDDKMALLGDGATNGGVCGECFLKLIPAQGQMQYPRIVVLNPENVRIVTAPDDCSLTLAYVIEYGAANDIHKRQIIARNDPDGLAGMAREYDLDDSWTITNYMRHGSGTQQSNMWIQIGEPEEWNYPFAPVHCCKNLPNPNESWGMPDLTPDLIDQNKTLIFLLSNLARIIKYHGHPKTWAKGLGASQISIGVDDLIVLASESAQIGVLTPMENFDGILKVLGTVMSNIDQQSRIPAVALGRQEVLPRLGPISGVALSLMFQPLIEKTEVKRRGYGKLIREVTRAALVLAGKVAVEEMENCKIGLHWQPLLPNDNLQSAQEALLLQQLGISMETILAGMNMNADDEAEKKSKEDEKQLTAFSRGQGFPPAPPAQPNQQQQPGQPPAQQPAQESPFMNSGGQK